MLEHKMYMHHEPPLPAFQTYHLHMSGLQLPVNTCYEKTRDGNLHRERYSGSPLTNVCKP
jgi:hypothetical protein